MLIRLALVLVLTTGASLAHSACWITPNGQIYQTQYNSSPPVYGARQITCPQQPQPSIQCPANSQYDGRGCRCNPGYSSTGQGCIKPAPTQAPSGSGDVCQPYYGQGYCTDYIAQRMGTRPRGVVGPSAWPANRDISQVREGVALIFGRLAPPAGHVAYVERVERNQSGMPVAFEVSEMNYGGGPKAGVPRECWVSNNFGKVTRRRIDARDQSITGFWSN